MDKIDFKNKYKNIYKPSAKTPSIVNVPSLNYLALSGQGDPNTSEDFSNAISALYGTAYTISMSYKKTDFIIPDFYSFVVPPLEGVWSIAEGTDPNNLKKDDFVWTIGIMMPEFVDSAVFDRAKELSCKKNKLEMIKDIEHKTFHDGLCCTMMHLGSFDNEKETFDLMEQYTIDNGYIRTEKNHREIYLNDFRKTAPEKLKTVLRYKIDKV